MPLSFPFIILIVNHIISFYYLLSSDYPNILSVKPIFLIMFFYFLYGVVGINIAFHRYFSHNSFETYSFLRPLLIIATLPVGLGSVISWVYIHRIHHKTSDTNEDPHSPTFIGWFKTLYILYRKPKNFQYKIVNDLIKDKLLLWEHRNYNSIILLLYLITLSISVELTAVVISIPALLCLYGLGGVTVLCHKFGYKNHQTQDSSRNNFFASLISLGEGWHNNHHANPGNYIQGEKWWEFDPPSWIITIIKRS